MDQPVVLGLAIALIVVILLLVIVKRRSPHHTSESDLSRRIQELKEATVTRKFHAPDDTDLDPNVEYINAAKSVNGAAFDLTIFTSKGIVETRPDLSEDEVWKFAAAGEYQHTADQYRTTPEGLQMIIQFERPRR